MSAELDFTKVNFGHMELAQADLVKIMGLFEKATSDLMTQLEQDLRGRWEGPEGAEGFFRKHQKDWDEAAAKMRGQLDELQKAIQIANENYRAAERRNTAIWMDAR
ncbi:WXG100 family type VII secretion target [Nonomuraea pusilla]|uniref:WXG100 family type VII secretion target n=1 Tax=Nonomuraea pusilla TaxID=46177 RepID=A0A1H7V8W9_9ACTN|nr:WXG100 family type VII secretion target [Nonomuraea pusilla]SEM05388.1 WXG100 family type VII secretion target [Nonomuraea pusilla]